MKVIMNRQAIAALLTGVATAVAILVGALVVPIEVRNSAPYGFSLTVDFERRIAVRGGTIEANYPNLNRLDLDLRAYTPRSEYDLIIHVRPDRRGAPDVRTIPLHIAGSRIHHDKGAFADPFVSVHFPPIADSAGQRYYVYVETGPRNRDDVVAVWSIKSYSRASGWSVLAAFIDAGVGGGSAVFARAMTIALLLGFVGACGWLLGATTWLALATTGRRWHAPAADGIQ